MITPLTGSLKRSIHVKGQDYTVILSPEGIRLTEKGKRKGVEFAWADLLGEGTALVGALNASLGTKRDDDENDPRH